MSWRNRRVSEMAQLVNGYPFDSADFSPTGDVPLVRIRDITGGTFETYVSKESVPPSAMIRNDDVLIGMDGDFNVALWRRGPAALNQRVCLLRTNEHADARYLAYSLPPRLQVINDLTYSTTVKHLSGAQVLHTRFAAPPLDEQRAIADYLDQETARIDALVAKQEEFIGLLRERRVAAIERAINPVDDRNPRVRLKYLLQRIDQGVSPQAENRPVEGDEWGVLKTGCINGGIFRQAEHKRLPDNYPIDRKLAVHSGDLIVSRANGTPAYVGSTAIVEQVELNLILSDKLFRLVPRPNVDTQFLAWSMNSGSYRTQVESSISGASGLANNLPLSDLRSFYFSRPELVVQRQIVAKLNDQLGHIDTLIAKAEEHIALAKERRAALITAAVTGQIDVRTATQKVS